MVLHVLAVVVVVQDNVVRALREDLVKIIVLRDVLLHAGSALDVLEVVWEVVVLAVLVLVDALEIVMVVVDVHLVALILAEDAPDV